MIFEIDDYFFLNGYNCETNIDGTFSKGGFDMDNHTQYINRFGFIFTLFFLIAMVYILFLSNENLYQFYEANGCSIFE